MQPVDSQFQYYIVFVFYVQNFICGIYYFNKFVLHHANVHAIILKTRNVSYISSGKEKYISSD